MTDTHAVIDNTAAQGEALKVEQEAAKAKDENIKQLKQECSSKKLRNLEVLKSQEQQQLGKKLAASEAIVTTQSSKV